MLLPDVTEILDDPEIGGGQPFTVVRDTLRRTLSANAEEQRTRQRFAAAGNLQPAQTTDLQLLPDEDRSEETLVIRSTFTFQLGTDGYAQYTLPDVVLYDRKVWKVFRIDPWQAWGFHTAYARCIRGVAVSDYM